MSLADDIRASREEWVSVGGHAFLVRRPTAYQFATWKDEAIDVFLAKCVIDWRDLNSEDLRVKGNGVCPPFEAEAFREWVQDEPETMNVIYKAVVDSITRYWEARDQAAKKPERSSKDKA